MGQFFHSEDIRARMNRARESQVEVSSNIEAFLWRVAQEIALASGYGAESVRIYIPDFVGLDAHIHALMNALDGLSYKITVEGRYVTISWK